MALTLQKPLSMPLPTPTVRTASASGMMHALGLMLAKYRFAIMVGTLGESSQKKAAFLLGAKDRAAALKGNESGKAPAKEAKTVTPEQRSMLDKNHQLMSSVGASGTPAILYLDETGMMQMHPGAPQAEQLIELFGPRP